MHPGAIYVWIWVFSGAEYQRGEEIESERWGIDEQPLRDKAALISIFSSFQCFYIVRLE